MKYHRQGAVDWTLHSPRWTIRLDLTSLMFGFARIKVGESMNVWVIRIAGLHLQWRPYR